LFDPEPINFSVFLPVFSEIQRKLYELLSKMPLKIIDHGSPEYRQMVDLRLQLLRKPLGLSFTPEELDREKQDILLGCFEDDKVEACCVLTEVDQSSVRLRQMAVGANLQGKGIGRVLMHFAENIARDRKYNRLTMHARKSAVGFYEKSGYHICSDEFTEVTIPHYIMEKNL
jgi:predicted GNAT family N-acyltransferase